MPVNLAVFGHTQFSSKISDADTRDPVSIAGDKGLTLCRDGGYKKEHGIIFF